MADDEDLKRPWREQYETVGRTVVPLWFAVTGIALGVGGVIRDEPIAGACGAVAGVTVGWLQQQRASVYRRHNAALRKRLKKVRTEAKEQSAALEARVAELQNEVLEQKLMRMLMNPNPEQAAELTGEIPAVGDPIVHSSWASAPDWKPAPAPAPAPAPTAEAPKPEAPAAEPPAPTTISEIPPLTTPAATTPTPAPPKPPATPTEEAPTEEAPAEEAPATTAPAAEVPAAEVPAAEVPAAEPAPAAESEAADEEPVAPAAKTDEDEKPEAPAAKTTGETEDDTPEVGDEKPTEVVAGDAEGHEDDETPKRLGAQIIDLPAKLKAKAKRQAAQAG